MSRFLGLDVGTQSTKAMLVDVASGVILAKASAVHRMVENLAPRHMEQDPRQWTDAVIQACGELAASDPYAMRSVEGISVCGQQHGLVALDGSGTPVRHAKLWCDTSTELEAAELSARFSAPIPVGFTASKVLWMMRHEPALWSKVATVLLPHDYINFWLTGEACFEDGDGSGTGWFDPIQRSPIPSRVAALELEQRIPRHAEALSIIGQLRPALAESLGLRAGIPVATGSGDNMMSALGCGAVFPSAFGLSLGTSGTIFTQINQPVQDSAGDLALFCDAIGGWLPLLCVMNMAQVPSVLLKMCGQSTDQRLMAAASEKAARIREGSDGLMLLPFLVGERVPNLPLATGTLLGLTEANASLPHLLRCALEGTALNLAAGFRRFSQAQVRCEVFHAVGGGAAHALWLQILADCLGSPIGVLVEQESAALGAALHAAWSVGKQGPKGTASTVSRQEFLAVNRWVTPNATSSAIYMQLLARFEESVQRFSRS
ncbi:MAG TPA: xylulokinase [Planctomycetota bacterium]|nr:xylulokinase [Planctomycetota bacterium]